MNIFWIILTTIIILFFSVEIEITEIEKPIDKQELKRERRRKNKLKPKNNYAKVQGKTMKYNHAKGIIKR